ncbi:MAG TPA: protein-disulfide reductase DsbD family protein, partial [Hyphomicrobium sp.]|nr:protein-disulfide reductase DsbD family protein [Hyphomicrobium sp.]
MASPWTEGFKNKARLLAGRAERPGQGGEHMYAAIEIEMQTGWKTYWRVPGDAGGIPPEFDLSASENAKDVTVLYPAP